MAELDPATLLGRAAVWAEAVAERDLAPPAALTALSEILAQSRGERLDLPDDPLLVAMLCGPTAVGKSSLINALAGAAISRPGHGAATAAAVLYIHEDDDPARLFEYSQTLGRLGAEPAAVVRHRRAALRHKVLVDTPDLDSAVRQHRETTAGLVHAADLVLFVTSPEKYKTMQAARWVAAQRPQRAIAFVLNKWDRDALGLQAEHRALVEADFRTLLAGEGFADPLVFKVSALDADGPDNELPALRGWLEAGLDHSAAAAIQERRRRAGWGRLGAAIGAALPAGDGAAAFAEHAVAQFTATQAAAHAGIAAAVLALPGSGLAGDARPATPGLLGACTRASRYIAGTAGRLRARFGGGPGGFAVDAAALAEPATLLRRALADLAEDALTARVRLGPAVAGGDAAAAALERQLAAVPAAAAAAVTIAARRLSLRRLAGVAVLYGVEMILAAVLALAGWRLAAGFVSGDYASGALLMNTVALLVVIALLGQVAGNLFFPSLQARWRRLVAQQAARAVDARWNEARTLVGDQLAGAARLAAEGTALLGAIDHVAASGLALAAPTPAIDRLFGAATAGRPPRQPVLD